MRRPASDQHLCGVIWVSIWVVTEPGGKFLEKFLEEHTNFGKREMVEEREDVETYKHPQFAEPCLVSLNTEVLQSVRIV